VPAAAIEQKASAEGVNRSPLQLPEVRAGVHFAAVFRDPAGRDDVLYPYLRDGLARGHSCTTCLSAGPSPRVLERLGHDVDVDANRSSGQLSVCGAAKRPPGDRRSGAEAAGRLWEVVSTEHPRRTYVCARFTVEAKAWLPEIERHEELLRFESRLVSLASGMPVAFMFLYDVSNLDGGLIVNVARTHAMVWMCGVPMTNPWFGAT
jgi:MEDS: MEthanogen/methylotroph, DcmR Sensory domain